MKRRSSKITAFFGVAQTISPSGVKIVPLIVETRAGDVSIRPNDPE